MEHQKSPKLSIHGIRKMEICWTFGKKFGEVSELQVVERRGNFDFVISDSYPTVIYGETEKGLELILYSIIPISPTRVILLIANGAEAAPKSVVVFNDEVLKKPKINMNKKLITIHVRKIYEKEVEYLNSALIREAHDGVAFRDERSYSNL